MTVRRWTAVGGVGGVTSALVTALRFQGARNILYEDFADPQISDDRDVIVKMERCGICGSDLHIYHGQGFSPDLGICVGHEAVGEVVETGKAVRRLKVGD